MCCILAGIGAHYAGAVLEFLLLAVAALTDFTWLFAGGAALVSVLRWTFAQVVGRYGFCADSDNGLSKIIRWMVTPSNVDALPALWFVIAFGAVILDHSSGP